jgi:hypothetical protein
MVDRRWRSPNLVIELPFRCSNSQLGSVVILPRVEPFKEPLDMRAWALQERFLSPRVLECGTLQTRWMCKSQTWQTDGFKFSNETNKSQVLCSVVPSWWS